MRALFSPSRTQLRRCMAAALLVALVLAQTLGWMHRSLHGGVTGSMPHAAIAAVAGAVPQATGSSWIADLFGNHADASDCRLYDVLGQAGCTPSFSLPAVVPVAAAVLVAAHGDFVARWAALFDARGPPSFR